MSYKESESLIKSYKPITPSLRHRVVLKGEKIGERLSSIDNTIRFNKRKLIKGVVNKRGRNNLGRITCYTKGGGNKRKLRNIDHKRIIGEYSKAEVISIENNPYSTASIALLKIIKSNKQIDLKEIKAPKIPLYVSYKNLKTQNQIKKWYDKYLLFKNKQFSNNNENYFYIIAPKGLKIGDIIEGSKIKSEIKIGRTLPLKEIPSGSLVHNIELEPYKGGKIARAAGTACILIKTLINNEGEYISYLKLPSKKIIELKGECRATIGKVSKEEHRQRVLGKAGASRWLGIRPKTRGEAKNAVDHPHGGKNHGSGGLGNQPKNRWGKLAKWTPKKKK